MDQEQQTQPAAGGWAVVDPDGNVVESGPAIEMTMALGVGSTVEEEDSDGVGSR